jgi:SAM-dependent methyltransferase
MTDTRPIIEKYLAAFREHGRSPASVLYPKGRQGIRFGALLSRLNLTSKSLLDFGCGLGFLCDYLAEKDIACQYLGVDIVADFIKSGQAAHPDREFQQITQIGNIARRFDIVLASGVFNICYLEDEEQNLNYVQQRIIELFSLCDEALTIDFMTSHVDFRQPEAFHADPSAMLEFALNNLSRRVIIDHSYMPYEFCMTVFKRDGIDKIASIFA